MSLAIFLVVASFLVWQTIVFYRKRARLPPGPFAVPLLGNFINEVKLPYMHIALKRLSARFGPVYTVHLPYPVVNISDFETLRDAFKSNDISGRNFNLMHASADMIDNGGIIMSQGPEWHEQRRFAISTLREFGMGKNLMEEKVRLSARNMLDFIDNQSLENVDLDRPIQLFVANIINEFLFGTQWSHDDCDKLIDFVHGLKDIFDSVGSSYIVNIAFMLPWVVRLPIVSYFFQKHQKRFSKIADYISESAAAVKDEPSEEPTCYVQAFRRKESREGQLLSCCLDLFVAGQETTSTTMNWAMLLLAGHQDVQDKLREEILSHLGRDRPVTMADKTQMPYANAVINEIQRHANIIAPMPIIFHKTTVDTLIAGHKIPVDTFVNGDLHQIMSSDPMFEQPERFWPERYLADDGVTMRKELVDRTIPFGIGKRQCAGEGLARAELFIGICSLIQKFRILPLLGSSIDLEPIYSSSRSPKPHNFRLERV